MRETEKLKSCDPGLYAYASIFLKQINYEAIAEFGVMKQKLLNAQYTPLPKRWQVECLTAFYKMV